MPDGRSGPGVWLRMVADRQAGSVGAGETPILYLPGVGNRQLRTDLRGLKDHPQLAPIAELQYRGVFWRQENSKDWTLRSFFESRRGGLGLKIAADQETLEALRAATGKLLAQNLAALEGQLIDQRFLDDLMNPFPGRNGSALVDGSTDDSGGKGRHLGELRRDDADTLRGRSRQGNAGGGAEDSRQSTG